MEKTEKGNRTCLTCGRILTNPDENIRLCPRCQKRGISVAASVGAFGLSAVVKKLGPRLLKGTVYLIRGLKK